MALRDLAVAAFTTKIRSLGLFSNVGIVICAYTCKTAQAGVVQSCRSQSSTECPRFYFCDDVIGFCTFCSRICTIQESDNPDHEPSAECQQKCPKYIEEYDARNDPVAAQNKRSHGNASPRGNDCISHKIIQLIVLILLLISVVLNILFLFYTHKQYKDRAKLILILRRFQKQINIMSSSKPTLKELSVASVTERVIQQACAEDTANGSHKKDIITAEVHEQQKHPKQGWLSDITATRESSLELGANQSWRRLSTSVRRNRRNTMRTQREDEEQQENVPMIQIQDNHTAVDLNKSETTKF